MCSKKELQKTGKNMETAKGRVLSACARLPQKGQNRTQTGGTPKNYLCAYCFMKSMKYESLVGMQPGSYYAAGH